MVIFTLFYCLMDLSCDKCDVISLYFMCCSVNGSVCLVCCILTVFVNYLVIRNICWCGCYFVVECYGLFSVGGGAVG